MAVTRQEDLAEALQRWQVDAGAVREQVYRAPPPRSGPRSIRFSPGSPPARTRSGSTAPLRCRAAPLPSTWHPRPRP
jgi:hypothetical protein